MENNESIISNDDKEFQLNFDSKYIKESKIQKYNLDEIAWKLFWVHSKDSADISVVLNMVLGKRREALAETGRLPEDWKYVNISTRDVTDFLRNMQLRIEQEEGRRLTRIRRKTLDSVKQLEGLVTNVTDYMGAWGDKVKDLMAQDDYDKAAKFYRLFQKDREQMMNMVKMLTDIRSRFKTYMAVDVLMHKVKQMIYVIEEIEGLPFESKDKILQHLSDIMRQAKTEYEED